MTGPDLLLALRCPDARGAALAELGRALEAEGGHLGRAARRLGVSYRSLMRAQVRVPSVRLLFAEARAEAAPARRISAHRMTAVS